MKAIASGLSATGRKNSDRRKCRVFTVLFSAERKREPDRVDEHDEAAGELERVPERAPRRPGLRGCRGSSASPTQRACVSPFQLVNA